MLEVVDLEREAIVVAIENAALRRAVWVDTNVEERARFQQVADALNIFVRDFVSRKGTRIRLTVEVVFVVDVWKGRAFGGSCVARNLADYALPVECMALVPLALEKIRTPDDQMIEEVPEFPHGWGLYPRRSLTRAAHF